MKNTKSASGDVSAVSASKENAKYKRTLYACYLGYITQAAGNNFSPLLFVTFHDTFGIPLSQITLLVTLNFTIQLLVDLISAKWVDKIGYRSAIVAAHMFSAAGLVGLAVFPYIMPPIAGLLLSVVFYAIGGGMIEVLISPIVEATPTENKASSMSLLHSFYCWGTVAVILISTGVFAVFGTGCWRVLSCVWAILPIATAVMFTRVPILTLAEAEGESMPLHELLSRRIFWIFVLLMIAAGASEQGMIQWASTFAERGLGVTKTVGDIVGPCMFAALQGTARSFYAKMGGRVDLLKSIVGCGFVCILSYAISAFSPIPIIALVGCALCGLSVGILWPGIFSIANVKCKGGGTAMFALLALAGDVGCAGGPTLVGAVSGMFGDSFTYGLSAAIIFPVMLIVCALICKKMK